nr:HD domain-containing protein [Bacillus sp. REN10]
MIEKAMAFAIEAHQGQMRKQSTVPYIVHPLSVGMILQKYRCHERTIAAGILHDVLEDTQVTREQLIHHFGYEVTSLVEEASEKDKSLPWKIRKEQTIQGIKHLSKEATTIVCADKLHNLSSIYEDYKQIGDQVWDRFNSGKEQQSWYYQSLIIQLFQTDVPIQLLLQLDQKAQRVFGQNPMLPRRQLDAYFRFPYGINEEQRKSWGKDPEKRKQLTVFHRMETLYRTQDPRVQDVLSLLEQHGINWQSNSDGPFLIASLCLAIHEHYQMDELEMVRRAFRNLCK